MNVFNDHKKLYSIAGLLFLVLTYVTVIMPALQNQNNNAPLPGSVPLAGDALAGKSVYVAEGCVGCHSQQVRNIEMDKVFGSRPGMPADYANLKRMNIWQNTSTVMGTERTGPDLTNIAERQSSKDWHLMHLFNPRSVVAQSIMPSYEWLFEIKDSAAKNDMVVNVPAAFLNGRKGKDIHVERLDKLDGEGLKGAFPPLKGSPIVNGDNLELYVDIIMNGYDARAEYGVMAAVGTNMNFTENDVAALINYERTSWGNAGKKVTPEEIKKIMDFVKIKASGK